MESGTDEAGRDANTDQENELLDLAQSRYETARERKVDFSGRPLHSKWREFDQIFRSKQWQEWVPEGKSMPVLNFTFNIIQSVLTRLTDTHPEILVLPRRSAQDSALAEILTSVQRYLWYVNRMQEQQLSELILHALKYGTGIMKIIWDESMWDDLGDVRYTVIHPMNFFPDPRAYRLEDMDYCHVRTPKTLEYILRRWPDKGHFVVPDSDWVDTEELEGRDMPSHELSATLDEHWFRDENGNACVLYYSGNVVLDVFGGIYDDPEDGVGEPVYPHNRFPFGRMVDYESDKEFWGIGEIEIVEMIQRLINSFEAQIIDNTRLMANAQWVVNKIASGLDEEDAWIFSNEPGDVIFTHNGGVDRIQGAPIPPHIPEHMERLLFWLEQITGVFDVVQGRRPIGVRAASAIIALQEAASIRLRQKSRNLGAAVREMSEQSTTLVLANYDEPRTFRIAGDTVPMTFNVREALYERMMEEAQGAGVSLPEAVEGPFAEEEMFEQLQQEIKFPEFDVEVKVGSSVPYSQALLYEQAKEFFGMGVIDREAVLEVTNFPNREQILQRIAEREAAAAEATAAERVGESV